MHARFSNQMLNESERSEACSLVVDIAGVLVQSAVANHGPSVAVGSAGHALFLAYALRSGVCNGSNLDLETALFQELQAAIDGLPTLRDVPYLYEGFTGIAWAVNHLIRNGVIDEGDEVCQATDDAVLRWLEVDGASMSCELIRGLAGLGLYGLSRHHETSGRLIVSKVTDALERSAVVQDGGLTWLSPPGFNSPAEVAAAGGCFNLGLSHGVPGALVFLARAARFGVDRAAQLASSAGTWLMQQRCAGREGQQYAYWTIPGASAEPADTRLAWCYGDLGIACCYLIAGREMQRDDWSEQGRVLARMCAERKNDNVMDGGLCHGAFGIAHLFRRLADATGEPGCFSSARHWFSTGMKLRNSESGNAGFLTWNPGSTAAPRVDPWQPETGYLEGIAGIGLALLGFLDEAPPSWDELLMIDVPSARG